MQAIIGLLIVIGILGSPLWLSLAIWVAPQRWWPFDLLVCGLQVLVAYFLWWFFWGGGIGGEARLPPALAWLGILALLPLVITIRKHLMRT